MALQLIGQIPEITTLAKLALDDAAKAYDGLVDSNARSMAMLHQVHVERLEILKAELEKDLSPEERLRVFDNVRDVQVSADQKDTENKKFLSDQFDKRLGGAVAAVVTVVFVASKSAQKPGVGLGRILAA